MGNFPILFLWAILLGGVISEPSMDYEDDVEIEDILELVENEPEEESKKSFDPDPKNLDPNFKPSEDDPRNIIFNNYEDWTIQANLERMVNNTFTLHLIELKDFSNHVTLRKVFIPLANQIILIFRHFENHFKSKVANIRDFEFISKGQKRNWNRSLDWS